MEQRDKLGLSPRGKRDPRHYAEATDAMDKVQVPRDCSLLTN
jgi:synaptosomal-associated protein 25